MFILEGRRFSLDSCLKIRARTIVPILWIFDTGWRVFFSFPKNSKPEILTSENTAIVLKKKIYKLRKEIEEMTWM